jgi:hypothetical protein
MPEEVPVDPLLIGDEEEMVIDKEKSNRTLEINSEPEIETCPSKKKKKGFTKSKSNDKSKSKTKPKSESKDKAKGSCAGNYSKEEDMQICNLWLEVSQDPLNLTNQAAKSFWNRIAKSFSSAMKDTTRNMISIKS